MKFKYNEEELKVLKNFSTINPNMVVLPDKFAVINGAKKSVVGYYTFDTPYDYEPYGIHNLPEFLTLVQLDDYELEVSDKYVEVSYPSSKSSTKYNLTDNEFLPEVGNISSKFEQLDVELDFDLTGEKLNTLKKVVNVLRHERIYFQTFEDTILMTSTNKSLLHAEKPHSIVIDSKANDIRENSLPEDVILYVNVEELHVMEGDYKVKISAKGISKWENQFMDVQYFIGVNTMESE